MQGEPNVQSEEMKKQSNKVLSEEVKKQSNNVLSEEVKKQSNKCAKNPKDVIGILLVVGKKI